MAAAPRSAACSTGRESLPGIEKGRVHSVEAVMGRQVRPGRHVVVFDEAGGWKSIGAAWKLAEDGHQVTIVTPDPMVGKELVRVAADFPARQTLAKLGIRFVTESGLEAWHGNAVTIKSYLDGAEQRIEADDLVLATTNIANNDLALKLGARGIAFIEIGDGSPPRQAPDALHEGRKVALGL